MSSLARTIYTTLVEDISEGRFAPGERMREEEIAARFTTSRGPVREAMLALAGEGFLEIAARRGARVAELTRQRALEFLDIRQVIADLALRRCAPDTLEKAADQLVPGSVSLPATFCEAVAKACQNQQVASHFLRAEQIGRWHENLLFRAAAADARVSRAREDLARRLRAGDVPSPALEALFAALRGDEPPSSETGPAKAGPSS